MVVTQSQSREDCCVSAGHPVPQPALLALRLALAVLLSCLPLKLTLAATASGNNSAPSLILYITGSQFRMSDK